jgi:hypothetical protein
MGRELDDIYSALRDGLRAAESLMTWQRGCDGRDNVNSIINNIKQGNEAYERLSRDLRDGRKHIADHSDDHYPTVRAANLEKADEGYKLCESCKGEGTTMIARMYPTGHTECTEECPDCDGEGQIELAPATNGTASQEANQ